MVLRKRQDFDNHPCGSWIMSYKEAKAHRYTYPHILYTYNNNIMLLSYYILFFNVCIQRSLYNMLFLLLL